MKDVCLAVCIFFVATSAFAQFSSIVMEGNFLQTAISHNGTLGFGGGVDPGLVYDNSGTGTFDSDYDYLCPGVPWEVFSFRSDETGLIRNNNSRGATSGDFSATSLESIGTLANNHVRWVGSAPDDALEVSHDYWFDNDDERISIQTRIEVKDSLTSVSFLRAIDPDPDSRSHGMAATFNGLGYDANDDGDFDDVGDVPEADWVHSEGAASGAALGMYTDSLVAHHAAITDWFDDPLTYLSGNTSSTNSADDTIGLAFDLGDLDAGDVVLLNYCYILGGSLELAYAIIETNDVFLKKFYDYAQNDNQREIAKALDLAILVANPAGTLLAKELRKLDDEELAVAMQQLAGGINLNSLKARTESFSAFSSESDRWMAAVRREVRSQMASANRRMQLASVDNEMAYDAVDAIRSMKESEWYVNGNSFGDWGAQDADLAAGAYGFDWNSYGFSLGADRMISDAFIFGMRAGGFWSDIDGDEGSGHCESETAVAELHAGYFGERASVNAGVSMGRSWNETDRRVIGGRRPQGDYESSLYRVAVDCGYALPVRKVTLEPYAGMSVLYAEDEAYSETGGGGANLQFDDTDYTAVRHALGAKALIPFDCRTSSFVLRFNAAWEHDYTDVAVEANGRFLNQQINMVSGSSSRDSLKVGLGLVANVNERTVLSLDYTGRVNADCDQQQLSASLSVLW